jgi:hypothetical protein
LGAWLQIAFGQATENRASVSADLTTRQEILKTAEVLLRAAQTMIDLATAGQLKTLADDYQRRAEKASHVDAAKAFARSAANAEGEWRT